MPCIKSRRNVENRIDEEHSENHSDENNSGTFGNEADNANNNRNNETDEAANMNLLSQYILQLIANGVLEPTPEMRESRAKEIDECLIKKVRKMATS